MAMSDPILNRFRAALANAYGDRIERVVLYGSRARGEAKPDSDYDVALFLEGLTDRWQEVDRIVDIEHAMLDETGAVINTMPFPAGAWRDPASPLMREIRLDGRDL
jgi:predicted nucleotidyltransferase